MRSLASLALSVLLLAGAARANEQALTQLKITPAPGKSPVDVWLVRALDGEGGVAIKVVARGIGPKPQSLTVYSGGGGDEGPGEEVMKSITMTPFELVNGHKGVRVDFTYRLAEGKHKDVQTDTWIVGFVGKLHKLIDQLRTRSSQEKNKYCREREETALTAQIDAGEAVLVAATTKSVEAVYGEDDLPVDPTCRAPTGTERKAYKLEGIVDPASTAPAPPATTTNDKPAPPATTTDKPAPAPATTANDKPAPTGAPKPAAPGKPAAANDKPAAPDKTAPKPAPSGAPKPATADTKSPDGGAPADDNDD